MSSLVRSARRYWPALALPVVIGVAAVYVARRPVHVRSARIEAGPVAREARGTGTIESDATVNLGFTVAGRLSTILVDEGQAVRAGDVLATLDTGEQDRQVSLAERSAAYAAGATARSRAEVTRAEANLEAASRVRARVDVLFSSGAISEAERDAAHDRQRLAEAELSAAIASRRQSVEGVAVAKESVRVQARRAEDAVLRSPIDGIVARRRSEPGDTVTPGAPVLVVASTQKLEARVWMDETTMDVLREGQPARVTLRGSSTPALRGRVDRIGVEADRATHELLVDVELLDRPPRVVRGQRVDAVVVLEQREAALRAPREACDLAASYCWVARGDRIARADVRFGLVGTEWIELLSGVDRGEPLLLPPPDTRSLPVGRRAATNTP